MTFRIVMPLLFSYGTLQREDVQLSTFGRRLHGQRDELLGCAPSLVRIDDPEVAAALGTHHANVEFSGNDDSRVPGTVFEITDAELARVDDYEAAFSYTRVSARLASGSEAWVYIHAGASPPMTDHGDRASPDTMNLVWPSREFLPGYVAALERGWSPDNLRAEAAAREELQRIARDADAFLASLVDRDARGDPIVLPDGSTVPRLPGYQRWMWDGEFCGSVGFRWQPGTEALPPHCLGHIGYSVVPWKRRRGYATRALGEMLRDARLEGLRYVEIATAAENRPSQRVIEANGGVLVEEFVTLPALGSKNERRYRVYFRTADGS